MPSFSEACLEFFLLALCRESLKHCLVGIVHPILYGHKGRRERGRERERERSACQLIRDPSTARRKRGRAVGVAGRKAGRQAYARVR